MAHSTSAIRMCSASAQPFSNRQTVMVFGGILLARGRRSPAGDQCHNDTGQDYSASWGRPLRFRPNFTYSDASPWQWPSYERKRQRAPSRRASRSITTNGSGRRCRRMEGGAAPIGGRSLCHRSPCTAGVAFTATARRSIGMAGRAAGTELAASSNVRAVQQQTDLLVFGSFLRQGAPLKGCYSRASATGTVQ